jgi:hypothetical protein
MKYTIPFDVESKNQPRAAISHNDPAAKALYYADATFNSEETTSRIPMDQIRFPEKYESRVGDTTTHTTRDGNISRGNKSLEHGGDRTRAQRLAEGTMPTTESVFARGRKGIAPQSDYSKQGFKGEGNLDDPLFGGAISYTSRTMDNDKNQILRKTENTTVDGMESKGMIRRGQLRNNNPEKKFGRQQSTQQSADSDISKRYRGQTLRTRASNFDNKEFADLPDESETMITRVADVRPPSSKISKFVDGRVVTESDDAMMRIKNQNDSWQHRGRTGQGRDIIGDMFTGIDSNEQFVGASSQSINMYGKSRNLKKHDMDGVSELF